MKNAGTLLAVLIYAMSAKAQQTFDYSVKVQMNGKETTLEQFKGKPLVLDLFNQGCVACFTVMPKLNKLQKGLEGKFNLVLLGDDKVRLPTVYEMFKKRYGLGLQAAYSKELFKRFYGDGMKRYLWIDANGIIRGQTHNDDITSKNLEAFMRDDYAMFANPFTRRMPFENELIPGELQNSLYRTSFSSASDSFEFIVPNRISITEKDPAFRCVNIPLKFLFNFAIWGRPEISFTDADYNELWPYPVSDGDTLVDRLLEEKTCYGMFFDGYRSPAFLKEVLKSDLKFYYGLEAVVEERVMPYWVLQRTDTSSQFLRKHPSQKLPGYVGLDGMTVSDFSIYKLLHIICNRHHGAPPFIDETRITWPIDIDFRADMMDIMDVQKGLATQGLFLIKKYRPIQVVKIKCVNRTIAAARIAQL